MSTKAPKSAKPQKTLRKTRKTSKQSTAAASTAPREAEGAAAVSGCPEDANARPEVPVKKGDHVYLVDGSGYIFRAFHALPPLTRPSDGLPVGAVHGFCQMLWKLLEDSKDGDRPTHLAVVFDYSAKTFRNEIYEGYKANRPPPPEDLVPQFPIIREATRAFNVACIEQEGYEADDLIATYTREALEAGADVTIVSSDKDLMQLIGPGVVMLDTMKGNRRIGPEEVVKKFGVAPEKVVDVQALWGDSSDNVPGVPGIGQKTAAQLIDEYGDLDTLLARAGEIKQKKRRENLIAFAEQARISRELVKLCDDVPLEVPLARTGVLAPDPEELLGFLRRMEFNTLTARIAERLGVKAPPPLAVSVGSSVNAQDDKARTTKSKKGRRKAKKGAQEDNQEDNKPASGGPAAAAARWVEKALEVPIDRSAYETVTTRAGLEAWIAEAAERGRLAFDTETDSLDAMRARLVGVSMALAPGRACYVPLGHGKGEALDLDGVGEGGQIPLDDALALLKPLLEDASILKIGQNLKYDALVLLRHGIRLAPFDDTMLLSFVLDAGKGGHGMDELSERWLGHKCMSFKDVAGSGKKQVTFDKVAIDKATQYAGEDADVTLRLWMILKPRLVPERMAAVYETLERPLAPVLVDMERAGIKVDEAILKELSARFAGQLAQLEDEIHRMAGKSFNIASPKQLGEILFDEWGLAGGKRTKTGAWGTGAGVLEEIAASEEIDEPIRTFVRTVLEWRQLAKLKSTYTDALPNFINPETGRIHTSFAMAAAGTGRLASSDPNLQNIPVRTPEGRAIRTAFIAEKGKKLISADYSQIELRVLAHIADIDALKAAFAQGLDIHAMTASEMFGVPIEGMPPEIRRRAKAINFGIIYGISAFGLAAQLGISRHEAADYIKHYFERFPGIRAYMDRTIKTARKNRYVETIFGRRIHYPDINTKNAARRGFLERAAINAPIQGSAADIIRRAMVRMPAALAEAGLGARMLLQVHDELIFEADEGEAEATIAVARRVMERAAEPAVKLGVPLKVDAAAADNWEAAH